MLVSALNERLEQMDVGHARKVFLDGFLRNREGFQMEIPLVPLGELYGTRLETWLREHEVAVRLTTGVRKVDADDEEGRHGRDPPVGRDDRRRFRGRWPSRSIASSACSPATSPGASRA